MPVKTVSMWSGINKRGRLYLDQTIQNDVEKLTQAWEIPLSEVIDNADLRLDATHCDRRKYIALEALQRSGLEHIALGDVADVLLPGMFTRIWANDEEFGLPYINATNLMELFAVGTTARMRYLSFASDVNFDQLKIHANWILVTCSGTIGRVFAVPKRMEGWVATHDIIRVVPTGDIPFGYIYAFLSTRLAQLQILGFTHGGQIDHVTHHQLRQIRIPLLPDPQMQTIHEAVSSALGAREASLMTIAESLAGIEMEINK